MEIPHFVYICVNWWTVELFSALAIMINAAMNSYVQVFVWTYDFICFLCLTEELADFSKVAGPLYNPTSNV